MSCFAKRRISACRQVASQSNQLISLSCPYALLLPCCVRRTSSPIRSIGEALRHEQKNSQAVFDLSPAPDASTSGFSVGAFDAAINDCNCHSIR